MSAEGLTARKRRDIEAAGGVVTETRDGYAVDFPGRDVLAEAEADFGGDISEQIERAVERAKEYGTEHVRLWRERGAGWYACTSHEEHPGYSYICQIDERTGRPLSCACDAVVVCHHLGRACWDWRQRVGWYESDAAVQAAIDAFGSKFVRQQARVQEEM